MKKYRRIEITAFRRRVLMVSGDQVAELRVVDIQNNHADAHGTIATECEKGIADLRQAVRILEKTIGMADR